MSAIARPFPLKRVGALLAWILAGATLALGAAWLARGAASGLEPCCAFRRLTGIGCPTCGMTRAMVLLLRGDARGAFAAHPLALPFLIEIAVAWLIAGAAIVARRPRSSDRWIPLVVLADAAAFACVWVLRFLAGTLPA